MYIYNHTHSFTHKKRYNVCWTHVAAEGVKSRFAFPQHIFPHKESPGNFWCAYHVNRKHLTYVIYVYICIYSFIYIYTYSHDSHFRDSHLIFPHKDLKFLQESSTFPPKKTLLQSKGRCRHHQQGLDYIYIYTHIYIEI